MFQAIQAKAAIERQQAKIRTLIEEQADRVEVERVAIEKRAGEQVRAAREEAARQAEEAATLEMELQKQVGPIRGYFLLPREVVEFLIMVIKKYSLP